MSKHTICAYPWIHMSTHLDGTMQLCCNTYNQVNIMKKDGTPWRLKEIDNPLEYFNSDTLKGIRQEMINGQEPVSCKKCYDIERQGGSSIRMNTEREAAFEEFLGKTNPETGELQELTLSYVHLMWGNKCNLKCKMCGPDASNQLIEEFEQLGLRFAKDAGNYTADWEFEANRQVLEKIAPHLQRLNVTGGEPLINNDFLQYCKYLNDNGFAKNVSIGMHTNLTVLPGKFLDMFRNFKSLTLKVSIDAIEADYEYIRYPGKWNIVANNLKEILEIANDMPNIGIEVHTVFTSFNVHAIPNLIKYLTSIKHPKFRNFPNTLWVTNPAYADSRCVPPEEKERITKECNDIIDSLGEIKENFIRNCVANLRANIKTMNESSKPLDNFIWFCEKQDSLRSIKSENIIPWWPKV